MNFAESQMCEEQEKIFERIAPLQSVMGREFLALQTARNKEKNKFEESKDKMGFDTQPYRRSEIALGRFLNDMIPRVLAAREKLEDARESLEIFEEKAQRNNYHGIIVDRKSAVIIWTRFAIEKYRTLLPKKSRKQLKMYHPGLWKELGQSWKEFRSEIRQWRYGGQPYDGSAAMHKMIAFQMKCLSLAVSND